ncbi:MAG TPA: phosphodiesterase [Spirochaetaceae bacterium]|nr:phosphodiesterase [Spirochaetaceae bacterium]
MRLLIASDIHGSSFWTEKLLKRIDEENPDMVVLLGDLLYHGPRNALSEKYDTAITAALLNGIKEKLLCVKGNCDSDVDQCVLDFPIMAEYAVFVVNGHRVYATHGDKFNKENPPQLMQGDILLNGHFHVHEVSLFNTGKNIYLNPGSVSIPKGGSAHSYAMIDDDVMSIMSLENRNVIASNDKWLR